MAGNDLYLYSSDLEHVSIYKSNVNLSVIFSLFEEEIEKLNTATGRDYNFVCLWRL